MELTETCYQVETRDFFTKHTDKKNNLSWDYTPCNQWNSDNLTGYLLPSINATLFSVSNKEDNRPRGVNTKVWKSDIFIDDDTSLPVTMTCAQQRLTGLGLPQRRSEPGLNAKQVQGNISCCQVQHVMQTKTGELDAQDQVTIRSPPLKICQFYTLEIFPNLLPVVQEFQERS